jgi:hypothetical protein
MTQRRIGETDEQAEVTMRRKGKHGGNPFADMIDAEPFLPDETAESARAVAIDIRDRVTRMEAQLQAQYSAMAAYATIAQQSVDTARSESRHDIDRSQSTVIGLIERVRRECADSIQGVEARLGGGPDGDAARMSAMEMRLATLESLLTTTLETQRQLMETVQVLMQERMQREGWLVSSGSADELSLR